ncbi:MAG: hypothetical protein ABFS56_16080 [Pseudomonadota bacterium]
MHNIQSRRFAALIILLIIIGIITRLEPLHDEQRLLKSISEDGYLMMTIARNMALGLGMSTADGTIPTNGTQPLTTFLWAGAYWLEGGDKVQTLIWIILMQFMFASLTAFLLWQFNGELSSGNLVCQPGNCSTYHEWPRNGTVWIGGTMGHHGTRQRTNKIVDTSLLGVVGAFVRHYILDTQ